MKKSLLVITLLMSFYSLQITLFSKRPQEKDFFSTKKQALLLQPTFGSPEFLYVSKSLNFNKSSLDLNASYLKVVLDLTSFPNLLKQTAEVEQILSFQLVSGDHKAYSLFLSTMIPATLEKNQFTGYFGVAHEETIPVGLYSLEVYQKTIWSERQRIGYQPNSVKVEEITSSNKYSFLVLNGLNFAANSRESQIFQSFLAFLENPKPALSYSSFLPSSSLTSKYVLYSSDNQELQEENFQKTLKRLEEVKFVVVLGNLVQPESKRGGSVFSKQKKSVYQENYEAFYHALKKAKKPFFLVPGNQESQILTNAQGATIFDGQEFFKTYFAPLNHWISYQGSPFVFLNTYEHTQENRILSPDHPQHTGGRITQETLAWLKTIPKNMSSFLFAAKDPRGGDTSNTYPFATQNFGELEDWKEQKNSASWMKPSRGDQRIEFLKYISELHQSSLFFGGVSPFLSNEVESGENIVGWKNIEDWRKYNLGPHYIDNFLIGTLLLELYYFVPQVLISERLAEIDSQVNLSTNFLTTTRLNQMRLGLPGIKGVDSAFITQFMITLEDRIQQMAPSQLKQFLKNPTKSSAYFAKKPEFVRLDRVIQEYRKILAEYQRFNPKIGLGLLAWQQGNSRFFLDATELEAHKKIQDILLKEKFPEQRVVQRNRLSFANIPPFCSKTESSNPLVLVTVENNRVELQPLKFYFEESFFCYMMFFLLLLLELFYFQWTRSLWEGLSLAFLETWKDFFGGETSP